MLGNVLTFTSEMLTIKIDMQLVGRQSTTTQTDHKRNNYEYHVLEY